MKRILFQEKVEVKNRYTIEDLFKLYKPRITIEDLEFDMLQKVKDVYNYKVKVKEKKVQKIFSTKYKIATILSSTPLAIYHFNEFIFDCCNEFGLEIDNDIYKYVKSMCHIFLYCPICNAFYQVAFFPALKFHLEQEDFIYGKTFLIHLKNIHFIQDGLYIFRITLFMDTLIKELNLKKFIFTMRPSLNKIDNQALMDIMILNLEHLPEVSEERVLGIVQKIKEALSKCRVKEIDYDIYELDYELYDIFNLYSLLTYRIPVEVYWKYGVNPELNCYLHSYVRMVGRRFTNISHYYLGKVKRRFKDTFLLTSRKVVIEERKKEKN